MGHLEKIYELYLRSSGICTDSRKLKKGELFWAIKGDNFDGNEFAKEALEKGALASVVSDPYLIGSSFVHVENGLSALQDLARLHRRNLEIPILALTGSNGKTTTKELIRTVLSSKFDLGCTSGNFNNHIGVPLTLLSFSSRMNFGILEMGANHQGEIRELCRIGEPDLGLITNIGKAHLEGFGGQEGIRKGKGEMYDFLASTGGTIFRNISQEGMPDVGSGAKEVLFSDDSFECHGNTYHFEALDRNEFCQLLIMLGGHRFEISTRLVGGYNYRNMLYAIVIGLYFEIDVRSIVESLSDFSLDMNRSQLIQRKGSEIVLDAYNANPTSVEAALLSFASSVTTRKKAVVLGDMLELGDESEVLHRAILELVRSLDFDKVFLVGPIYAAFKNAYPFQFFNSVTDMKGRTDLFKNDAYRILIKGSRGMKLEALLAD